MTVRAGIVVTGTEVLSGSSGTQRAVAGGAVARPGVELAHLLVVGDRPEDLRAGLEFLARRAWTS